MSFVFREGASGKEKVYTLVSMTIVLLLMGSASVGRYQFYENPGYGGVIVWLLAAIWVLPALLDKHPSNKIIRSNIVIRGIYWVLWYLISYGLTWGAVYYAIPAYYTNTFGEEASFEQVVTRKGVRTGRLGHTCYSIDYGQPYSTCVNQRFFDSVEAGDTIRLNVLESHSGYFVRSVQKLNSKNASGELIGILQF
ncbi:hypothetical protein MJO52_13790 [Microbulbifer variabilis]|uniref:DUF2500 family protein n=1 Tax=Microbulbifer variabilis TaxID=266805 RepID=A0ABY4V7A8_9GAMM|nr:hypothetical protein [Microbulbifer variabilis]USD20149.1 hypothetical protein MJO52_13790 [Microbulbifer variabilis]